jgi:prepilin-type N-terminal cleavage/methylation domain-containing protein
MKTAPRGRTAFTLVETLVVVVILALLATLLFPVIKQAITKSRIAKLSGNLKNLASGIHLYANDNNDRFPSSSEWSVKINPYLGNLEIKGRDSLFHDPLDTNIWEYNGTKRYAPNIAINGMAGDTDPGGPTTTGATFRARGSISQPSKLLLLTTGRVDPSAGAAANQDYNSFGVGRLNSNNFRTGDTRQYTRIPGLHYSAFADGHVEAVSITKLMEEVEKDRASISQSLFFDAKANNGTGP